MGIAFDLPDDVGGVLAEMERRIRILETAARVPALSTPGSSSGIQFSQSTGGVLASSGAVTDSNLDSPASAGPSLTASPGPSGSLVLMYGCSEVYQSSSVPGSLLGFRPVITHPTFGTLIPGFELGVFMASTTSIPMSRGAMVTATYDGTPWTVTLKFTKQAGAYTANFTHPWLMVIPL